MAEEIKAFVVFGGSPFADHLASTDGLKDMDEWDADGVAERSIAAPVIGGDLGSFSGARIIVSRAARRG